MEARYLVIVSPEIPEQGFGCEVIWHIQGRSNLVIARDGSREEGIDVPRFHHALPGDRVDDAGRCPPGRSTKIM